MDDVKITYIGKGKIKKAQIVIINDCSIYNVENIYNIIQNKMADTMAESITVQDVSNIDLAGVQLLVALKKLFIKRNEKLVFQLNVSDDIQKILLNCGFNELLKN